MISRIIITGPESTGKTVLTKALQEHFGGIAMYEYAREYIASLNRVYTYSDLEHIASVQKKQMAEAMQTNNHLVFFDTYLIITKVWFDVAFSKVPFWLQSEINNTKEALYLLCKTDIPWTPDPLREHGGKMRDALLNRYKEELEQANLNYVFIEGQGENRIKSAIEEIRKYRKEYNGE